MLDTLRHWLLGPPLPTQQLAEQRLSKVRALAAFSPDALSSIAYANQEIYLGLLLAGSAGLALALPVGLAITGVLVLVALSYYQTIQGYPSGGGSYVVARSNLGQLPGLVAGASLLVDYVLTAAVSLTAGVDAIASAFPWLWHYRVEAALLILAAILLINLRGVRETGGLMAFPVYFFLLSFLPMLAFGAWQLWQGGVEPSTTVPPATQPVTLLLLAHAFATGCTALTGIETISNGVPVFRPPESRNAGRTLLVMTVLMGLLFLGSLGLTQALGVVAGPNETILSALTRKLLGAGPVYVIVQLGLLLILAVAANSSFAGFPRVAALLAQDGFLPRQLTGLGDRLVFANGMLLLALAAGGLIVLFRGDTHALVPLFALGAFLAFTLSQAGMVVHWRRARSSSWAVKATLNGLGAAATLGTFLVVAVSKFTSGAWITAIVIPSLVLVFLQVRRHYRSVAGQLSLRGLPPSIRPLPSPRVVIPISGVHLGVVEAVNFARSISDDVTAVFVELEPGQGERVRTEWQNWYPDVPIAIVASRYRSIVGPLLDFLDETDRECDDGQQAAVILPEFVPAKRWQALLHNQTANLLRTALLYRRRRQGYHRVIIDVPHYLRM